MSGYQVISDLYNRIFLIQHSDMDLSAEYYVWNSIMEKLPRSYRLPDLRVVAAMNLASGLDHEG